MKKHIYLIDTKLIGYYLHQRGSGVHGMLNKIADLLINHPKGDVVLAFDVGKSDYRLAISPTYKGHRAAANNRKSDEQQVLDYEFQNQYINFIKVAEKLPCGVLAVQGVEADDLISLIVAKHQKDPDTFIYMVTADMDYVNSVVGFQNTFIIDVFNQGKLVKHEDVVQKYNLTTRRMFNVWKSIYGDKSDNIKFIKGMAEVKAKTVFDTIYSKYQEPTDDEIVHEVEQFLAKNKRLHIHPHHTDVGRLTVKEAFDANMKLADTFTDLSLMTEEQKNKFLECCAYKPIVKITHDDLFNLSFDILGSPIMPNDNACKVFNIKEH
jgi:5'-3' exonuclease